jgi:hypothetical protein
MPNIPSPDPEEDDDDAPLTQEEINEILGQFPEINDMSAQDCCIMAGFLLDVGMPVPTDLIARAHRAGFYIAH